MPNLHCGDLFITFPTHYWCFKFQRGAFIFLSKFNRLYAEWTITWNIELNASEEDKKTAVKPRNYVAQLFDTKSGTFDSGAHYNKIFYSYV